MKKLLTICLTVIIGFNLVGVSALASENFDAVPYLLVYSIDSDEVVLEKNADKQAYPASITKVLTALVAYENITDLNEKVIVTEEDLAGLSIAGASVVGLEVGNEVSYSDLIYSLLIISAGDSAQVLANHIFGSEEKAVAAMNEKAQSLGMNSSHFANPTGLHDDNHYTTMNDLLLLMKEAMSNEFLKQVMSTMKYSITVNPQGGQLVFMHTIQMAKLDSEIVENYITGGKTGSTNEAGSNLMSFGEANGINYIVITVGIDSSQDNFAAVKQNIAVYEYLDSKYQKYKILDANSEIANIKILHSNNRNYSIKTDHELSRLIDKSIPQSEIEIKYNLEESYSAPMKAGDKLGSIDLVYQGDVQASYEIIMDKDIEYSQVAVVFEKVIEYWYLAAMVIAIIVIVIYIQVKKIKERNKTRYRL